MVKRFGKSIFIRFKRKVFEAYTRSKIKDKTKIAKRFKVSYDFVNNLINLHEETGSLCPRKRTGNKATKMTIETLDYLSNLVKESNDYTLSESDKLRKDKGIETGTTTIFVALRKLGISLKKNHIYQRKRDSEEIIKERLSYLTISLCLNSSDLVFIDETGTNLSMNRAYAR
ncbi:MAG: hypothetical protein U0354_07440 [Candidatus Sericytochromatia bacterium]